MYNDSLFNAFARSFEARSETDMSMAEYLESCRGDPMRYANAAERLLAAIGEPQMIDTAKDPRLGRMFLNRTMRAYPAFVGFHGMEETIERIVGFFRHAAQGLEERKQILYLLGPVGGGKSSLAERLKSLMEVHPIYVLKAGDELSPVFEVPLSLFDPEQLGPMIEEKYGIPRRRLSGLMSPWCYKRLEAFGGDISSFRVAKIQPSRLRQIAIAKTEPGDENNQDISSLVGKVDIRKLETFAQNDPDAYSYSGGLNRANQGVLEFVEMFKAPIKMLHPLLTATQEGNYIGTENIGAIPFTGRHPGTFQRIRMAEVQVQQEQRSLHRPYLRHQGALLPAGYRGAEDLREADLGIGTCRRAVCAGHAGNAGALLRHVASAQARELDDLSPRCASMTAKA